jgi:streptogramin lyase
MTVFNGGECTLTPHAPVAASHELLPTPVQALAGRGLMVYPRTGAGQLVYSLCHSNTGPAFVIEMDPATGDCTTYPAPTTDSTVYPAVLAADDKIYFATFPSGDWFRFDPVALEFAAIGNPFPGGWTYSMRAAPDGMVYGAAADTLELAAYDPVTGEFAAVVGQVDGENSLPRTLQVWNGAVYIGVGPERCGVYRYTETLGLEQLLPEELRTAGWMDLLAVDQHTGNLVARYRPSSGGEFWYLLDTDGVFTEVAEDSLSWAYAYLEDGREVWFRSDRAELELVAPDGSSETVALASDRVSTSIYTLATGPGGVVYGGTYPIHLFAVDPADDLPVDLGNCTGTTGEIYSMAMAGDLLYMAAYPRGNLSVLDTSRTLLLDADGMAGAAPDSNPRSLGYLDDFQHRPLDCAVGPDGRIYMAVLADYGGDTGSLSVYDPQNGGFTIHQPYTGDSLAGLAVVGDELWCASLRKLFRWDIAAQEVVAEYTPVPEASGNLTRLAVERSGIIIGAYTGEPGYIFAFDPAAGAVLAQHELATGYIPSVSWNTLATGPDGQVYVILSGDAATEPLANHLCIIDPVTCTPRIIWTDATGEYLRTGFGWHGDSVYAGRGQNLSRLTLVRE